jgi:hypothetical protein
VSFRLNGHTYDVNGINAPLTLAEHAAPGLTRPQLAKSRSSHLLLVTRQHVRRGVLGVLTGLVATGCGAPGTPPPTATGNHCISRCFKRHLGEADGLKPGGTLRTGR